MEDVEGFDDLGLGAVDFWGVGVGGFGVGGFGIGDGVVGGVCGGFLGDLFGADFDEDDRFLGLGLLAGGLGDEVLFGLLAGESEDGCGGEEPGEESEGMDGEGCGDTDEEVSFFLFASPVYGALEHRWQEDA